MVRLRPQYVRPIPRQYGWIATAAGPNAVNKDPPSASLNGLAAWARPVLQQNVDHWDNVPSITDPRSAAWQTTYRYNADNQVIE